MTTSAKRGRADARALATARWARARALDPPVVLPKWTPPGQRRYRLTTGLAGRTARIAIRWRIPAPSLCRSGRSWAGSGRSGLLHGRHDLVDGRLEKQPFLGHRAAVHQDGEFPRLAVHQLHLDARFLPQSCRQTGGVLADAASERTFPDRHLLHRTRSFRTLRATHTKRLLHQACRADRVPRRRRGAAGGAGQWQRRVAEERMLPGWRHSCSYHRFGEWNYTLSPRAQPANR